MLEHRLEQMQLACSGITLHVVMAGPRTGEPIMLLHGFPEFWYGWRHQIDRLAAAGFRVIVPDQRGYNLSDKPNTVAAYTLDVLALDIINLIAALGYQRVHLAGHDWGAAVAWELAEMHPQHVQSLAILNVPHTRVFEQALKRGNFKQIRKSSYMMGFQIPGFADRWLCRKGFAPLINGFLHKSVPGTFTELDIQHYQAAWSQPGALTAMLNWYRAAGAGARKRGKRPEPRIHVPTLILWGEQDAFVEKQLAGASTQLCDDVEITFLPDAGHFVQHEKPEAISTHLIHFLEHHRSASSHADQKRYDGDET